MQSASHTGRDNFSCLVSAAARSEGEQARAPWAQDLTLGANAAAYKFLSVMISTLHRGHQAHDTGHQADRHMQ